MICSNCGSTNIEIIKEDFDSRQTDYKGDKIVIPQVESMLCSNCGEDWITPDQLKFVRQEMKKRLII